MAKGSFEKLINSKTPVIIYWHETYTFDFESDDNEDDQMEVFDKLKESLSDKIKIVKIDVYSEINKQLAKTQKIRKFPLLQIYKEGKEIYNSKGFKEFSVLMDLILDSYSTGEKYLEED